MRTTTKLGKHVEDPISGDCWDKISSLPDELLGHILSFLPTKGAVSTSILSTRWRYLFTLTSCLSFDDAPCFHYVEENERIEATQRFKDFVNKTLELHQISPIKKFSLLCRDEDNSDLNRWLSIALRKDVQELHYEPPDSVHCVPDGFFSCETLLKLKMIGHGYNKFEIPLSAWLPKLKILHLDRIMFTDFDSMERLFSSCELLEELTLKACDCDSDGHVIYHGGLLRVLTIERCSYSFGTFEIDAPHLAYLSYSSNIGVKIVPSWKSSGSFIKARLIFKCSAYDDDESDTNEDSVEYERELLKAAAYKVTELCFEMDSVEVLLKLDDDEQMPDFSNLTRLELDNFPYTAWEYVTSLLDKSPQLETLIFEKGFRCCSCPNHYCEEDDDCYCDSLSPSDIPLDPFSCQAQVIEVHEFCTHKGSLSLTGHLLKNASVLKRLILHTPYDDDDFDLKISQELLMLPRASKDCCLEMQ
ncbi:F-box protein At4g22280-like [Silene latifolia]|uniref:F-box protein At4g22280-like n=1 Tax=Silene latifolia TaxID=37657 RepID=UPI003D772657